MKRKLFTLLVALIASAGTINAKKVVFDFTNPESLGITAPETGKGTPLNDSTIVVDGVTMTNTKSNADWSKMEAAGCVFLPAAGQRNNTNTTTVIDVGTDGRYWTSTMVQNSTFWSDRWNFNASGINYSNGYKSDGLSVRLVKNVN